jgi:GTP-binding protein LepA
VGDPTNTSKEDISMLDTLAVEQERGITVKATTASMAYTHSSGDLYLINLFDSPGHVDFSHEVSRSLSCVDGAIILFDASQGIQAQTVAVYEKAKEMGLPLIPVLTKVDMPSARPLEVAMSVSELFPEFDPDEILLTSARKNQGMTEVLDAIVEKVPPPTIRYENDSRLRCKVVDSWFEVQRGVVCLLKVEVRMGWAKITAAAQGGTTQKRVG